jgi:hypothetical protein
MPHACVKQKRKKKTLNLNCTCNPVTLISNFKSVNSGSRCNKRVKFAKHTHPENNKILLVKVFCKTALHKEVYVTHYSYKTRSCIIVTVCCLAV